MYLRSLHVIGCLPDVSTLSCATALALLATAPFAILWRKEAELITASSSKRSACQSLQFLQQHNLCAIFCEATMYLFDVSQGHDCSRCITSRSLAVMT